MWRTKSEGAGSAAPLPGIAGPRSRGKVSPKHPYSSFLLASVGGKEGKGIALKGLIGMLLFTVMLGLAGCWGVGETGWGNPDICSSGQFTSYPGLMMADDVLLLQGDSMRSLYALQVNDGDVLWKYRSGKLLGVSGSVVFEQGLGSVLYALRASDGSQLWHFDLAPRGGAVVGIVHGMVYVSSQREQTVYALRGVDGEQLWQWKMRTGDAPEQVIEGSGLVYLSLGSGEVVGLDEKDGKEIWRYRGGVEAGTMKMYTGRDTLFAVSEHAHETVALNSSDGAVLWHLSQAGTLVVERGVVYMSADRLYAMELRSGKVLGKWPLPEASRVGEGTSYALTVKDSVMFVGPRWTEERGQKQEQSEDTQQRVSEIPQETYRDFVVALDTRTGRILWEHQLEDIGPAELRVADGDIYVLGPGTLEALSAVSGAQRWQQTMKQAGMLVSEGVMYTATAGNDERCSPERSSRVTAVRTGDGARMWQFEGDGVSDPSLL